MRLLFFSVLFLAVANLSAQPGGGRPCPKPPCPPPVPITGIEYLVGLGGLYGVRRLLKSKNKTNHR
ncbi:MAG: hypothetical protein JST43_07160 [Bacteroidetes bacterium]|nr:hypothetical protein [Bacteroidota bacterium]MBS1541769.1 hypothetical protein [Bacteroidota bacterium]